MRQDIANATNPLQVCAGLHDGSCEAAVHVMQEIFHDLETEGVLLVDATNAFNMINCNAALHNIHVLCPVLYQILSNTYRTDIRMIISTGGEVSSSEGTYHLGRSTGNEHVYFDCGSLDTCPVIPL